MLRTTIYVIVIAILPWTIACQPENNSTPKDGHTVAKTERQTLAEAVGGEACGVFEFSTVEWNSTTPLGTPEAIMGAAPGTCTAPLTLNDVNRMLTPFSYENELSITLTIDETTASIGVREDTGDTSAQSARQQCATHVLKVNGSVSIQTADGVLLDTSDVTLYAIDNNIFPDVRFEISFEETGGTLALNSFSDTDSDTAKDSDSAIHAVADSESVADSLLGVNNRKVRSLLYRFTPPGMACIGELMYTADTADKEGPSAEKLHPLAFWSPTGCPGGGAKVNISETYGNEMIEQITAVWQDVRIPGVWDNGIEDALLVTSTPSDMQGCEATDKTTIDLPVTVTYTTQRGILTQPSDVDTTIRLRITEVGELEESRLQLNDGILCPQVTLPADWDVRMCDSYSGVAVQLGVALQPNGYVFMNDGLCIGATLPGSSLTIDGAERHCLGPYPSTDDPIDSDTNSDSDSSATDV